MVEFNLLPWRTLQHQHHAKIIKINLLMSISLALTLLAVWHWHVTAQLNVRDGSVSELKQEISYFSQLNSKSSVSKQDNYFKFYRKINENLFQEIAQFTAPNICFTKIARKQNKISLVGYAPSATELTHFLKSWAGANLFSEMRLTRLEFEPEFHRVQFQIQALLLIKGQANDSL